jgi:hypothetical protein
MCHRGRGWPVCGRTQWLTTGSEPASIRTLKTLRASSVPIKCSYSDSDMTFATRSQPIRCISFRLARPSLSCTPAVLWGSKQPIGVGMVPQIALRTLTELKHVKMAPRVQERFQILGQLWPFLHFLLRWQMAQLEVLGGVAEVVLMASVQKCGDRRARIQPVKQIYWSGRLCAVGLDEC